MHVRRSSTILLLGAFALLPSCQTGDSSAGATAGTDPAQVSAGLTGSTSTTAVTPTTTTTTSTSTSTSTGYIPSTVAGGNQTTASKPKPGNSNTASSPNTTSAQNANAASNANSPNTKGTGVAASSNTTATGSASVANDTTGTAGSSTSPSSSGSTTTSPNTIATGTTAAVQPVAWPSLDFVNNPGGDDPTAFALTFDDGPDGSSGYGGVNNTNYILDQLKTLGVPGAFFLCSKVWTDMGADALAQAAVRRMVAEGHEVANHTYDHQHLTALSPNAAASEFSQNQNTLWSSGALASGTKLSMYRACFGQPFQANTSDVTWLAPVTAPFGVHVGWGLDSNDWSCAQNNQDVNCIVNNINYQLDRGQTGVILMHAVYRLTGDALPAVVAAVKARGGHFVTLESMVQAKYGATSAQLMAANANASFTSSQIGTAARTACGKNNANIDPPYPNAESMAASKSTSTSTGAASTPTTGP